MLSEMNANEKLDKMVSEIFDELVAAITIYTQLHPSEEVNRNSQFSEFSNSKIYDIINDYHVHCILCDQHFYCQTRINDINSFFQKHINTNYHKAYKLATFYPNDKPIFEWEKWLYTGHCNVCNISDIHAYIVNTDTTPIQLIRMHDCKYDKDFRESNQKYIKKVELLRKYCSLSFFVNKFISVIDNDNVVCLLCSKKLFGTKKTAQYHLVSDGHFYNFCSFVWKKFVFAPKDLLNGYNLEQVTRKMLTENFLFNNSEPQKCNERKKCIIESNDESDVYKKLKDKSGFSPKHIEGLLKLSYTDLMFNNKCLLCDAVVMNLDHISKCTQLHIIHKETVISQNNFDKQEKYNIYLSNREKRLKPYLKEISLYTQLQEELKVFDMKIGMVYNIDWNNVLLKTDVQKEELSKLSKDEERKPVSNVKEITSEPKYISKLIEEKLALVEKTFSEIDGNFIFCEICSQRMTINTLQMHLYGKRHKAEIQKWKEFKLNFTNLKFVDPILKVKEDLVCLICCVFFKEGSLFSHLKGSTHIHKFEMYAESKSSILISESFNFKSDYSCYCTNCDSPMNKKGEEMFLNLTLKNIKNHWPCSEKNSLATKAADDGKLEEVKSALVTELEIIFKANKNVVAKNQNIVPDMLVPCSTCGKPFQESELKEHAQTCAKLNLFDFGNFQKTVRTFMNLFEDKIIQGVADNSRALIDNLDDLKISENDLQNNKDISSSENTSEQSISKIEPLAVKKKSVVQLERTEEKCVETKTNLLGIEKAENKQMAGDDIKFDEEKQNEKETDDIDDKHEALIITGLPKSKRKHDVIYFLFKQFGKIKYLFFEGNSAVLAFFETGIAEKIAKGPSIFLSDQKLDMICLMRSSHSKALEKHSPLNKDIAFLLEVPQRLVDFAMKLVSQSLAISQSPGEKKREELVCSTIISAVSSTYPHSRCYPFGSRLSGLTLKNSDFDVFLDCGGMYEGINNTGISCERRLVNKVAGLLRKKRECADIIVVDRARVPIISFLHKPTMMHCDLSFKNGLSVQNTLLLRFMVSLDWRVKPLILFLKHWADSNCMHGPPFFSSYAIAMMVIFYLEQLPVPVLPTIKTLQKNYVGRRLTIGGWDCSFSHDMSLVPKTTNNDPLPMLIKGFFEFYATFDYSKFVISPLTGTPLLREAFFNSADTKLPMSIKKHIINITTPLESLVNDKIPICVMDPFDLSHILTKSFTKRALLLFVHYCSASISHLEKGMFM